MWKPPKETSLSNSTKHMSAADLQQACEAAHQSQSGNCSGAVRLMAERLGHKLPELDANGLIDYFNDAKNGWTVVNETVAQGVADIGGFVVAGKKASGHGHLVVVMPGGQKASGGYNYIWAKDGQEHVAKNEGDFPRSCSTSMGGWPGAISKGEKTVLDAWGSLNGYKGVTYWQAPGAVAATKSPPQLLAIVWDSPVLSLQPVSAQACVNARSARLPGPRIAAAPLPDCEKSISAELSEACSLTDVTVAQTGARGKVFSWLRLNQDLIIDAETKWLIDRRAIAGVIAWEALFNVKSGKFIRRWEGPGKVHYWDVGPPGGTQPSSALLRLAGTAFAWTVGSKIQTTAELTEDAGYLPSVSEKERGKLLKTIGGSITYIAAIMRADADVVSELGEYPDEEIYWNPPVLATLYNTKRLDQLRDIFKKKKYPEKLVPGEKMGEWVAANMTYLEDAVGKLPEGCRPVAAFNRIKR